MRMWLAAFGLLLILASGAARAQQASPCAMTPDLPGAWEATGSVLSVAQEWHLPAVRRTHDAIQSDPESGRPARARAQVRIGCRHRNPHLGILRFNPELGRDMTGTRHGDSNIVREEIVRSILKASGPGPPAPVGVIYLLASARRELAGPHRSPQPHFQSGLRDPS